MSGSQSQRSTTTTAPPRYISQAAHGIINSLEGASNRVPNSPFAGPFLAQPTADERSAVAGSRAFSQSQIGSGDQTIQYGKDVLDGKYLDPNQNQAFKDYVNLSVYDPLYRNLTDVVLPNVESAAIGQGAFGGSRNAVADTLAYRETANAAADQAARAAMGLYTTERGFQHTAPEVIGKGIQMNAAPHQALVDIGAYERSLNQIPIDEAKLAFEESTVAPWRPYITYADLVAQLAGTAGGTTTATGPGANKTAGGISGGLGGAAAGAALGSVLFPGVGTAIGAGAGFGGLLGAFGGSR